MVLRLSNLSSLYVLFTVPLVVILTSACGAEHGRDLTKAQAIAVADASFEREFPDDRRDIRRPIASDHGKYWLVEYDLPPGYAGGTPTFVIDKGNGSLVTAFTDQ
jgi:hypothetical protein